MIDVSIVIPTYRPSARLTVLVGELSAQFSGRAIEIILVDDGNDTTGRAILDSIEKRFPTVRLLNLENNRGQRFATLAGVAQARGRFIVTMDDDRSHPSHVVPAMLEPLEAHCPPGSGFNLVYAAAKHRNRGVLRLVATAVNNLFFSLSLHKPFNVPVGSFRAFTAELSARAMNRHSRYPYLSALLLVCRPRVTAVYYRDPAEDSRPSRYSTIGMVRVFVALLRYWGPFRHFAALRSTPPDRSPAEYGRALQTRQALQASAAR